MNTPRLSIIIPVYNVELYVEECIKSIQNQTFPDFEAIIVDDGSKDSSIEKCNELIKRDSRFTIIHKKNGGLMSAWKFGLSHAKSEYIGFVDSDDWIDSNMYEILYREITESKADIVVSGFIQENNSSSVIWTREEKFIYEGENIKKEFVKEYCNSHFCSLSHPSINRWDKLYRKDVLVKNMKFFNENVSLAEDFNTNISTILDANKIVLIPDFTPYHYRYNPKSIVNSFNPKAFENIKELGRAWNKISEEKGYRSIYVDGFIGNIIFEEINKICTQRNLSSKDLIENLELCDGFYFLSKYAEVRGTKRIRIYNWLIQHKLLLGIKILNILNKYR